MKFKNFLSLIILSTFPILTQAGDLGNETDEPNGRSTSVSIDICKDRMSFKRFHEEMMKRKGYKQSFERLETNYLPLYNKIMKQGSNAMVCMTGKSINELNPWLPSDQPRVSLWIKDGEGRRDSLQFDPKRYFDSRKNDIERAVIVVRELLHEFSIENFSEPNQRVWIMHNLINEMYDLLFIKEDLSLSQKANFLYLLDSYSFMSFSEYIATHCQQDTKSCKQSYLISKEAGYDVLDKNYPIRIYFLYSSAKELQDLDNIFQMLISNKIKLSDLFSNNRIVRYVVELMLLKSDTNDLIDFVSLYHSSGIFNNDNLRSHLIYYSKLAEISNANIRYGTDRTKANIEYLKEQSLRTK